MYHMGVKHRLVFAVRKLETFCEKRFRLKVAAGIGRSLERFVAITVTWLTLMTPHCTKCTYLILFPICNSQRLNRKHGCFRILR